MSAGEMTAMAVIEEKFESIVEMLVPINSLSPQSQQRLLTQAEVVEYRRGQFVFREGERDKFSFFLMEGVLDLLTQDQLVKRIVGGTPSAKHALAQLQPRQLSARAQGTVSLLRVDRNLLDKLLALDGSYRNPALEVRGIDTQEDGDWMTRMLQSELFARVPAANIQRIFTKLEGVGHKAGDVVVHQGAPGDYYYVIQEGRCEVSRSTLTGKIPIKLAELGPGDTFGEEALITDATRNATVTMLSKGELMRLTKADFIELIKKPILSAIGFSDASRQVEKGDAVWLDVRFPEEFEEGSVAGSLNYPLNTLRMHAERLDRKQTYIVCCDSGSRSSVGAFLLSERGFNVHCLKGGLHAYGLLDTAADDPAGAADDTGSLVSEDAFELFDDDTGAEMFDMDIPETGAVAKLPAAGLVPASQQTEDEQLRSGTYEAMVTDESALIDADVKAQALKTELAKANIQLEEARRLKEQAEAAKHEAQNWASATIEAEREKLAHEADKARKAWQEAKGLKAEAERAKQQAREQNEQNQSREAEELAEASRQLQEAKRLKEEAEAAKRKAAAYAKERLRVERQKLAANEKRARETWTEAQRLKKELEVEKHRAEEDAEHRRHEQEQRLQKMQADAERRMREEEKKLEASYTWQAEELERLKLMRDEAENQLQEQRDRLRLETEEATKRLAEAKRIEGEVEQAQIESAREAEDRQQRQLELEDKLRDEINEKVQSERRKLEAEFARNAEELDRARREKAAAEAARVAAAEEAERIIQEYKETHESLRRKQEEKLRAERERLENEKQRLAAAMEEIEREKKKSLAIQRDAEAQMVVLNESRAEHVDTAGHVASQFASEIAAVEAEVSQARAQYAVADQAQRDAQKAALVNQYQLDEHRDEENSSHAQFEQEIEGWLREQEAVENSEAQQQILANQRSHLQRIKKRAEAARRAAKAHDQTLIEELAARLRGQ